MKRRIHKALQVEVCDQCNQKLSKDRLKVSKIYFLYLLRCVKRYVFSRIRTEYGEIRIISPQPVQIRKSTGQKNSQYGHFSGNAGSLNFSNITNRQYWKLEPFRNPHLLVTSKLLEYLDNWLYIF